MKAVLVLGKARSGKSSFSNFLSASLHAVHVDLGKVVAARFKELSGIEVTPANKEELRPHLVNIGDAMTLQEPEHILRSALMENEAYLKYLVVTGVRRSAEMVSCREWLEGLGFTVVTVWIMSRYDCDKQHCPADRLELDFKDADERIHETQTLDDLEFQAQEFAELVIGL